MGRDKSLLIDKKGTYKDLYRKIQCAYLVFLIVMPDLIAKNLKVFARNDK